MKQGSHDTRIQNHARKSRPQFRERLDVLVWGEIRAKSYELPRGLERQRENGPASDTAAPRSTTATGRAVQRAAHVG
jgi:hypothetical protein